MSYLYSPTPNFVSSHGPVYPGYKYGPMILHIFPVRSLYLASSENSLYSFESPTSEVKGSLNSSIISFFSSFFIPAILPAFEFLADKDPVGAFFFSSLIGFALEASLAMTFAAGYE